MLKCKGCGADISDEIGKEVAEHVIKNMPPQQTQIQVKEKIVPQYPPEMKLVWCPDCHTHHNNTSYKKPTKVCNDCDAKLDSSRDRCVFCGSEDIEEESSWW